MLCWFAWCVVLYANSGCVFTILFFYDVSAVVDVVIAIVVWSSLSISLNISPSETLILSSHNVDKVAYTGYGLALEVFSVSRISVDIQSQLL